MKEKIKNAISSLIGGIIATPLVIVALASVISVLSLPILGVIWLIKAIF